MKTQFLSGIAALLAVVGGAVGALAAEPVTIKIADHLPAGHIITTTLTKPFMARVEELTGGKVKFQYFPSEQLVKQTEALPAMQRGIVQMSLLNPGLFPTEFALTGVTFLPGGYDSIVHGGRAITKLLDDEAIRAEFAKAGVVPLLIEPIDGYEVMTRSRPVRLPADVKGLRVRAAGDGQTAVSAALGGVSVTIGSPEIYTAIQRGTVDGAFFAFSIAKSYRLSEVAKFSTYGANVAYAHVIYCVEAKFWNALDPSYRAAMRQAAAEVLPAAWAALDRSTGDTIAAFKAAGMQIVDIHQDAAASAMWKKALAPVRDSWAERLESKGKPGKQVLDAWLKALQATR